MESKAKKHLKKYYLKEVIREISERSHYVCEEPVEWSGNVFVVFFHY